jgi:hypothetical protein
MAELPRAEINRDQDGGHRKKHQRHLRNILLDRRLQLRYIATVTLLSALISSSLGYLIWRQEARASALIMESLEEGFETEVFDPDLQREIRGDLSSGDDSLILTMVAFGFSLVLVLSLFLLIMTHKVAGPLYKVSHHFDDLAAGRFRPVRPLRRFDMLHDFHHKFEETHRALIGRLETDCEIAEKVIAAAARVGPEAPEDLQRAVAALEEHVARRRAAVEN